MLQRHHLSQDGSQVLLWLLTGRVSSCPHPKGPGGVLPLRLPWTTLPESSSCSRALGCLPEPHEPGPGIQWVFQEYVSVSHLQATWTGGAQPSAPSSLKSLIFPHHSRVRALVHPDLAGGVKQSLWHRGPGGCRALVSTEGWGSPAQCLSFPGGRGSQTLPAPEAIPER